MNRPVHCGKNATPYRRDYGWAWETGWRCKVCGAIRLPVPNNISLVEDIKQAVLQDQENDKIRLAGIAFDASLHLL